MHRTQILLLGGTLLACFTFANAEDPKKIEILSEKPTSRSERAVLQTDVMDSNLFQDVVRAAIRELEGSLAGTCAKEMVVLLKIDAKAGGWKIAEIGVGGTVQVKILNPKLPANCAR